MFSSPPPQQINFCSASYQSFIAIIITTGIITEEHLRRYYCNLNTLLLMKHVRMLVFEYHCRVYLCRCDMYNQQCLFQIFSYPWKKTVFLKGTGETVKLVIMEIKKAYKQLVLAFLYTVAFVQTRLLDML